MESRYVHPFQMKHHAYSKTGFMRHPPNLLKQESSSAATLVNVLLRIASDKRPEQAKNRDEASNRLILCVFEVFGDIKLIFVL